MIAAQRVVCGDIIHIRAGSRVPADARIIWCNQLKLEASSITGESEPIDYTVKEAGEEVTIFEARNVAFNGSLAVDGEAFGLVIRCGSATVIGQIAEMTTGQSGKKSRLEMQVRRYVKFLVFIACTIAITVFIIGGFVHKWRNPLALLAQGFIVSAIGMVPSGLPATVTSILTLIGKRLAAKNVLMKRLDIVEALGQVNISEWCSYG